MPQNPCAPAYEGRCISQVLGTLVHQGRGQSGLPDLQAAVRGAERTVLLIVDGLGAQQLAARAALAPGLLDGSLEPITSVAPSTTAAALTSISTGVAPGSHGLVGYRFAVGDEVLQALRWTVDGADARARFIPEVIQPVSPQLRRGARGVPYVGKPAFATSGFTRAHLRGASYRGAEDDEALVAALVDAVGGEDPLAIGYHDAVDKVAHIEGLGEAFDAEIARVDALVHSLRAALPERCALVVTADHGQVDVGPRTAELSGPAMALVDFMSGEGRFRWLHAHHGERQRLFERASEEMADTCWVRTRRQVIDDGWLGEVDDEVAERLGDVALIPFADVFVPDPAEPKEVRMKGRHGSLTEAEMLVPLIVR